MDEGVLSRTQRQYEQDKSDLRARSGACIWYFTTHSQPRVQFSLAVNGRIRSFTLPIEEKKEEGRKREDTWQQKFEVSSEDERTNKNEHTNERRDTQRRTDE